MPNGGQWSCDRWYCPLMLTGSEVMRPPYNLTPEVKGGLILAWPRGHITQGCEVVVDHTGQSHAQPTNDPWTPVIFYASILHSATPLHQSSILHSATPLHQSSIYTDLPSCKWSWKDVFSHDSALMRSDQDHGTISMISPSSIHPQNLSIYHGILLCHRPQMRWYLFYSNENWKCLVSWATFYYYSRYLFNIHCGQFLRSCFNALGKPGLGMCFYWSVVTIKR